MAVPTPQELIERYGRQTPEALASLLGFQLRRVEQAPLVTGVTVMSEYQPGKIVLYLETLRAAAARLGEPFVRLEQWHIAHELYHGMAETGAVSAWRVRETEADLWADELMTLVGSEG